MLFVCSRAGTGGSFLGLVGTGKRTLGRLGCFHDSFFQTADICHDAGVLERCYRLLALGMLSNPCLIQTLSLYFMSAETAPDRCLCSCGVKVLVGPLLQLASGVSNSDRENGSSV